MAKDFAQYLHSVKGLIQQHDFLSVLNHLQKHLRSPPVPMMPHLNFFPILFLLSEHWRLKLIFIYFSPKLFLWIKLNILTMLNLRMIMNESLLILNIGYALTFIALAIREVLWLRTTLTAAQISLFTYHYFLCQ